MKCSLILDYRLNDSALQVCIYQSTTPQQICVSEYLSEFDGDLSLSLDCAYNMDINTMTTAESMPGYKLQPRFVLLYLIYIIIYIVLCINISYSVDSGWDNPFRPDGELSREADEIVKLISGISIYLSCF